jgi:2-hydroxychromene-2-carboxylate isomerase
MPSLVLTYFTLFNCLNNYIYNNNSYNNYIHDNHNGYFEAEEPPNTNCYGTMCLRIYNCGLLMSKTVDYFLSPMSPWAYLGHEPLQALIDKFNATVNVIPIDPAKLFAATGGVPVAQRPIQRQKYRLAELKRWKSFLGSPIVIEPAHFPYNPALVNLVVVATVNEYGAQKAMELTLCLMKGCWVEDRNMGLTEEVKKSIESCDLNSDDLLELASNDQTSKDLEKNTQHAIDAGVFGAPTYIINGELYWGQDRLDFVQRSLMS